MYIAKLQGESGEFESKTLTGLISSIAHHHFNNDLPAIVDLEYINYIDDEDQHISVRLELPTARIVGLIQKLYTDQHMQDAHVRSESLKSVFI